MEINNEYLSDLEMDAPINGAYRDLREYLPRLAKFYLSTYRKHALFLIAPGGDGCPFGKHESACSFLVSFLNVGRKVASSHDNFCILGANCDETSQVVKKYVRSLVHQIAELDKKIFQIDDWVTITFKVQELPNDMKMLAMLAGELVISSKYFSPFANVCKDDATDLQASFGPEPGHKWQPWEYKQRVNVVGKVESFKKKIERKTLSCKVKQTKVTEFIASQKSRQEFLPLLDKYIYQAHVEPLHLKNNAWQYFFKGVLKEAIRKSKLPVSCKTFSEVPEESVFGRLISSLKMQVKAGCLCKKVKRWFDDTEGSGIS